VRLPLVFAKPVVIPSQPRTPSPLGLNQINNTVCYAGVWNVRRQRRLLIDLQVHQTMVGAPRSVGT